jgi:hypothetical protein
MMSSLRLRLFVGLGLPTIAIALMVPLLDRVHRTILGMPFILAWLFAWYVLTTLCLAACWFLHDRTAPDESF